MVNIMPIILTMLYGVFELESYPREMGGYSIPDHSRERGRGTARRRTMTTRVGITCDDKSDAKRRVSRGISRECSPPSSRTTAVNLNLVSLIRK